MATRVTKVSIVVPTYQERDNVALLCDGLRTALAGLWDYEVIIVDDNSPDGTAEVVRALAAQDSRVRLLQRPGKLGLGSAVTDGFRIAKGDYWLMMDADLSHRPQDAPTLLQALANADIVVGSRHVKGGGIENWPFRRRFVSSTAAAVARRVVGVTVRDPTSGFAAFQRKALEPLLPELNPKGFKLLLEVLAKTPHAHVKEVPILFVDRRYGKSKFTMREVLMFLRLCLVLRGARRKLARTAQTR